MDTCSLIKILTFISYLSVFISSLAWSEQCGVPKVDTGTTVCNNCNKYESCENGNCICPRTGVSPCRWVECNTNKDCWPGSCDKQGGTTCTCHSGFSEENCKKPAAPILSHCNLTITYINDEKDQRIGLVFRNDITAISYIKRDTNEISGMEFTFFPELKHPIDKDLYDNRRLTYDFIVQRATVPFVRYTCQNETGPPIWVNCSEITSPERRLVSGNIGIRIQRRSILHYGTVQVKGTEVISVISIIRDTKAPIFTNLKDAIFFCNTTVKEPKLQVYWKDWTDGPNTNKLTYKWFFDKMKSESGKLVPMNDVLQSGNWSEGDEYPIYRPPKDQYGVYMAVLKVEDEAGNSIQTRTWALYTNETGIETRQTMTIREAAQNTSFRWITNVKYQGTDELTLDWSGHFKSKVPPEVYKRIEGSANDNVPDMWKSGPPAEIKRYQYQWIKNTTNEPSIWINTSSESAKVMADRNDRDKFTAWVKAYDHFGNNLVDHMEFYVDSTPPSYKNTSYQWNTYERIDGVQHYTSSFKVEAEDKDSGIYLVQFTIVNERGRFNATALSVPKEKCKAREDCICSIRDRCQLKVVDAALDNCIFLNMRAGNYTLETQVYNEAMLPSPNTRSVQIKFDPATTDGLNTYPGPENLTSDPLDKDTVLIRWQYIKACYNPTEIDASYSVNGDRRNMNISDTTTNTFQIDGLKENDEVLVDISILYEGGNKSEVTILRFVHNKSITSGTVVGIVFGVILGALVVVGIPGAFWYRKRKGGKPLQSRPLPTPPAVSQKSRVPLPEPPGGGAVNNGFARRAPPPVPTESDDEIEIYGNAEVQETLRTISPQQYTLGSLLGSGRLAVVKQATLKDSAKHVNVAAKMAKKGDSSRDNIIIRAKLNFMATTVTNHPNVVNLVAADLSAPIIFLELCEEGPLADWVKDNDRKKQSVKDTMTVFCLDIAKGLNHLHKLNVVHRRLGVRNVLLTKQPKRMMARIMGFGPLESELGSDKEDTKVPVRWMSPESLYRVGNKPRIYNKMTDMWSYGVTVWEIFSDAVTPFKGVSGPEVKAMIQGGTTLPKPSDCPQSIYDQVMDPCWKYQPEQRPTAEKICNTLTKQMAPKTKKPTGAAIDLDVYENANPNFQGDDIYENNLTEDPPMYLDMCV